VLTARRQAVGDTNQPAGAAEAETWLLLESLLETETRRPATVFWRVCRGSPSFGAVLGLVLQPLSKQQPAEKSTHLSLVELW